MRNANCRYVDAEHTWKQAKDLVGKLENLGHTINRALLYSEFCALLFAKSQYDDVSSADGYAYGLRRVTVGLKKPGTFKDTWKISCLTY